MTVANWRIALRSVVWATRSEETSSASRSGSAGAAGSRRSDWESTVLTRSGVR